MSRIGGDARDITVDGAYVHDMHSTDLVAYHVDGMAIFGGQRIAVVRSRFRGNMITNIRVQNCCGNVPVSDLRIENNWFAPPLQGDGVSIRADGINVDNDVPALLLRNNSFASRTGPQLLGRYTNARIVGNLFVNAGCVEGVRYSYNVVIPFSAHTGRQLCGAQDKRVAGFGYVDESAFDFRITPSSPAVGRGDRRDCPAMDILGFKRPRLLTCDAGAVERPDIVVCHRTKMRPARWANRRIPKSALKAYLRNGDRLGACPGKRRP